MEENSERKHIQEGTKLARASVKTEGFEKTVVFMMELNKIIWGIMNQKENFNISIGYRKEGINTNIGFYDSEWKEKIKHTWVKTEGFEKAVVLMMELNKMIWTVMNRDEDFKMVLEYHKEALNVSVDFFSCKAVSESGMLDGRGQTGADRNGQERT